MKNFYPVFKREMRAYFYSPTAYVLMAIFLLILGYFFYIIVANFSFVSFHASRSPGLTEELNLTEGILRPMFNNMGVVMLLMMPILTMRLFAEEQKSGTLELLLTFPITDVEALLAKFAASVATFLLILAPTLFYLLLLRIWGKPELGPVFSAYLGLTLMGASFISLGVLASTLTENQIVAAVISFGALLFFWVIGWARLFTDNPLIGKVVESISLLDHFDNFSKGVISTADLFYYLGFVVFFLFLSFCSLESKKWRGME